jgi:hypothetical protein
MWREKEKQVKRTSRVSKYSPTLATNCSLRSSPSGGFSSGASVWGRERRAREVLARERRWPMSCVGRAWLCNCSGARGKRADLFYSAEIMYLACCAG